MFPDADPLFVPRAFGWAIECFTGNHADYQAVDARYHDFEHTLQGTLCLARLLRGRHLSAAHPRAHRPAIVGSPSVAILLHDTGSPEKARRPEGTARDTRPRTSVGARSSRPSSCMKRALVPPRQVVPCST